jgi:hypothetical protein
MVDDKLVSRSFWVGDIQHVRIVPTIFLFFIIILIKQNEILNIILVLWQRGYCGVLLILFFIGSSPINPLLLYIILLIFG